MRGLGAPAPTLKSSRRTRQSVPVLSIAPFSHLVSPDWPLLRGCLFGFTGLSPRGRFAPGPSSRMGAVHLLGDRPMSAILLSDSWPVIHRQFEAALPQIDDVIRFHSRRWPKQQRSEMMADARAAAWHAWFGLLRRGKDPLAVGPTGLARNACRYVKGGRRLGTTTSGRSAMDVYNRRAQRRNGIPACRTGPSGELQRFRGRTIAGRNGPSRTIPVPPPTRRASGSISRPGWLACLRGSDKWPSFWPTGMRRGSWPETWESRPAK